LTPLKLRFGAGKEAAAEVFICSGLRQGSTTVKSETQILPGSQIYEGARSTWLFGQLRTELRVFLLEKGVAT
jgi:hypothetical protein